jgi:oligopeptidase B
MTDPTIPLTVQEWEEWGNSNEKAFFDYMSLYCPYTNIKRQNYPALLITAGLNDPRVQYWEPLKWASKLREFKTNPNIPVLLKTDLGSGHFSSSDRYRGLREKAFELAFVVDNICN